MELLRVSHYYTTWSFILHILFKDTYWIAKFVKYVGNAVALISLLFGQNTILSTIIIFISHEIPYIYKKMKHDETSKNILVISLLIYVSLYGIPFIYDLYMNKDFIEYIQVG
tara:strand:+ start:7164 stop:7499 length:336 start_codon:yes stop_codon:yes gene_type:complete